MPCHAVALFTAVMMAGCVPVFVPTEEKRVVVPERREARRGPVEVAHDFGLVLTRGQTLRHAFRLSNDGAVPIRLVGAEALKPCCSSIIGPLAETVPAGGSVEIPVAFRPGAAAGRQRIEFVVGTDEHGGAARRFALMATLAPEMDVELVEGSEAHVLVGRPGRQVLRVINRRVGDDGRAAPATLRAEPSLNARFLGTARERAATNDGLVESVREIEITLPASTAVESRRGGVVIGWADGTEREHVVSWSVRPAIRAVPPALFVKRSEGRVERVVRLVAVEKPLRIVEVTGEGLVEFTREAASEGSRTQVARLTLDPTGMEVGRISNLVFTTDDPDQPRVEASVVVVAGEGSEES